MGSDVEAVDGRYEVRASIMIAAPIEQVRAWLADDARLVDWVPDAAWGAGPADPGEVRLDLGRYRGGTAYVGRTTVEPDGDVVRRWVLPSSPGGWDREVRYATTRVQGGTLLHAELVTTIPGARARALRAGARAEAKGLDGALDRLARAIEGRRPPRRTGPEAGPL